ncbi:hypothetical protein [Psychrobacter sp. FDAARGOS_221]|uniref:hypothetical protein n=1 Tax=Psychrobacter sp. FDAARGOS_221 TaxID=1975705 RepID=UPI0022286F8D|nr:hypothetical protein [Psychrobacter sp. FDAARGOS_221]
MSTNLNKGLTLFSVCAATILLTACQGVDKSSGSIQTVSKQLSQGQQFMLEPNTLDLNSSKVKTVSSR